MTRQRLLALILAVYAAMGVLYSLATPPLEASDEFDHYPYVQYVQSQCKLPVMDPQDPEPWRQEGGQPPLYYLLMAGLTSWIDTSDLPEIRWLNRHAFIGIPGQVGNKNLVIHRSEREAFPWQGAVLAIHVIRLASVALGGVVVWLTWRVAAELCPRPSWVAPLAAALTAFNPMFLFVSAAVNNDVLAALLGALTLLLLIKARLPASRFSGFRVWVLGVVLGLGALTKVSLLALLPLALLAVALRTWCDCRDLSLPRRFLLVICHCSSLLLPAFAIAGWWYFRNWRLYGDPTALNAFIAILGVRAEPLTRRGLLREFGAFRRTYWGLFGGVNVPAPEPVYVLYDLLSLVGLIGLALHAWRRRKAGAGAWWVPAVWVVVLFAALLRWTFIYYSFQGRLMFPGIAAISTFLGLGLGEWFPRRWRPAVGWGVGGVLLLLAAAIPFVSIIPVYALPRPLALGDMPQAARWGPVVFGDGLVELVGVELSPQVVIPGEPVEVVLYWSALAPLEADYLLAVHLLGRGMRSVGQVTRHPALGAVPTSLWEPGQVWRDRCLVYAGQEAEAPTRLRVMTALYDPVVGRDLEAMTADGTLLGPVVVGEAKLAARCPPEARPAHVLAVDLADGVSLMGYDLEPASVWAGEVVTLTLYWEAWAIPAADYQVFVHMLGEGSEPLVQADAPPLENDYPTTMWAAGEVIADPHLLVLPVDLPRGKYRLLVGMYDLGTMARLARLDGAGDSIALPTALEVR